MLYEHVFQEMKNSHSGFLRLRACWLYGEFGDYRLNMEGHIQHALQAIYDLLSDKDLPVRLNAACSLHKMLGKNYAVNLLKPHLENLLKNYLLIM